MEIIKKYNSFLEALRMSLNFINIIDYLINVKRNKVALFLSDLRGDDYYKDDEDLNFISTSMEDNMVTYLVTNKRGDDWEENMTTPKRTSIRVGRAIKRIYEKVKPTLNIKISEEANISRSRYQPNKFFIDFNSTHYFLYLDEGLMREMGESKKIEVKLKVDDKYYNCELLSYESNPTSITLKIDDFIECPVVGQWEWHAYLRKEKYKFLKNVEIELKSNLEISDSDIEKFTNEYISFVKANKSDETSKIEEVKGRDIRYWYNSENYQSTIGKLGNSCMSHEECSEYLDIYVDNTDMISLLILKNKNNKLVGRALLWKLDDGRMFMDRIYTSNDSDDNIFINYAIEKGYLYRNTSNQNVKYYKDGKEIPEEELSVTLKYEDYSYYPYIDTLYYLEGNTLTNIRKGRGKELRDTDGRWSEYYQENNDDYD